VDKQRSSTGTEFHAVAPATENKKASIRWQDSAPPISGCLSCNNR